MLFENAEETLTDFEESAAQYVAVYFRRSAMFSTQRRTATSMMKLFEVWGGIGAFLYLLFGVTARMWNRNMFSLQIRGLDLRKLDAGQFTAFGRLIEKSFQMPREFQFMSAE